MDRRQFLAAGAAGALAPSLSPKRSSARHHQDSIRALFPRMREETFISAAAGTPLGTFAEEGIQRYMAFQTMGPGNGRRDYVDQMLTDIRGLYGGLIGARASEIALVHSTKAGEHLVLQGMDVLGRGGNIVTNDMHFAGALHNLVGLQRAGADVRIVRNRDWDVATADMAAAIDDDTRLVVVTLVSNVTGRVEPMRAIADIAHAHGALVYADIIQAAGILPMDVREMGIDFAAANGYKWLYGVHGSGFLYVREELQGGALPDALWPGSSRYNYPPWTPSTDPAADALSFHPRTDASRYEPGHVSYLGYCAVYEGLKFLHGIGVDAALAHSVRLNSYVHDRLDPDRYHCLSIHRDRSPILTYAAANFPALLERLRESDVVISLAGGSRVRISPGMFNTEADMDKLAAVMNAADG